MYKISDITSKSKKHAHVLHKLHAIDGFARSVDGGTNGFALTTNSAALSPDSAALSIGNNHADLHNSVCSSAVLDYLFINTSVDSDANGRSSDSATQSTDSENPSMACNKIVFLFKRLCYLSSSGFYGTVFDTLCLTICGILVAAVLCNALKIQMRSAYANVNRFTMLEIA